MGLCLLCSFLELELDGSGVTWFLSEDPEDSMFPVGRKRGWEDRKAWDVCEAHGKGTPPSSQHGQNQ